MIKAFPFYTQLDAMDCGPTCLRMIARYYGKSYSLQSLRSRSYLTRNGVSLLGISDAAEAIGFRTIGAKITFEQLISGIPLPCILHWNQNHFVVCYNIRKKNKEYLIDIADPVGDLITYKEQEFRKQWITTVSERESKGTVLILEPSAEFYEMEDENKKNKRSLDFFLRYLSPYKKELLQLMLGMLIGSLLQLIFPFLTQSLWLALLGGVLTPPRRPEVWPPYGLSFMLLVGEGFIPPVHLPIAATFSGQHLYRPCERGAIYAFRRH